MFAHVLYRFYSRSTQLQLKIHDWFEIKQPPLTLFMLRLWFKGLYPHTGILLFGLLSSCTLRPFSEDVRRKTLLFSSIWLMKISNFDKYMAQQWNFDRNCLGEFGRNADNEKSYNKFQ